MKKATLDPVWDEMLEMSIYDKDIVDANEASERRCRATLSLELWDHDMLGLNDSLGHCEARLAEELCLWFIFLLLCHALCHAVKLPLDAIVCPEPGLVHRLRLPRTARRCHSANG